MKVIKKMTRKQFLETMAAAVAGTVIGSLMSGCSSLGQRPTPGPLKILSIGDKNIKGSSVMRPSIK